MTTTGTRSPDWAALSGSRSTSTSTSSASHFSTTGAICASTRSHEPHVERTISSTVFIATHLHREASWVPFRLLNTQHLHVRCTVTGSGVDRGTALTDRDRADRVTVAHHGSGPATATGTPSGPELKVFARSRGGSWTCLSMGCGRRSKGRRKAKAHNALVACLARISGIPETMLNSGVNFRYIRNL